MKYNRKHEGVLIFLGIESFMFLTLGLIFLAPCCLFDGISFLCSCLLGRWAVSHLRQQQFSNSMEHRERCLRQGRVQRAEEERQQKKTRAEEEGAAADSTGGNGAASDQKGGSCSNSNNTHSVPRPTETDSLQQPLKPGCLRCWGRVITAQRLCDAVCCVAGVSILVDIYFMIAALTHWDVVINPWHSSRFSILGNSFFFFSFGTSLFNSVTVYHFRKLRNQEDEVGDGSVKTV